MNLALAIAIVVVCTAASVALMRLSSHWPMMRSWFVPTGSMTAQGLPPLPSLHSDSQAEAQHTR